MTPDKEIVISRMREIDAVTEALCSASHILKRANNSIRNKVNRNNGS